MEIIPAVDIRQGKCVRLYRGDYSTETVFSEDPVSMALHWEAVGARRLHIVDLDGASEGRPGNASVVQKMVRRAGIPVQIGGGIRTIETISYFLGLGVQRVILGTVAIEKPDLVEKACHRFGDRVIVSIDAENGYVKRHGWKETSSLTTGEAVKRMESCGVRRFIYTDISRDGTLTEPNFEEIEKFKSEATVPVIAAGGIASLKHLRKLHELGLEGAIVGRAVYTGDIDLREGLATVKSKFIFRHQ